MKYKNKKAIPETVNVFTDYVTKSFRTRVRSSNEPYRWVHSETLLVRKRETKRRRQ